MPFLPPPWMPPLPCLSDTISVDQFLLEENAASEDLALSTCGITGKTYSRRRVRQRVEYLARAIGSELSFEVNGGTEFDKVVAIFSLNTIDTLTLTWATHRLGGLSTPANAQYSQSELEFQLKDSKAKCLFTCQPLLEVAKRACRNAGIPDRRIYLLEVPEPLCKGVDQSRLGHQTVSQLIHKGISLPALPRHEWLPGEATTRTALLCYSSGTSGLPKGVKISHYNVVASTVQTGNYDSTTKQIGSQQSKRREECLTFLPFSHIYGLVYIAHTWFWRGDNLIILPGFDLEQMLGCIQRFRVQTLFLVPPVFVRLVKSEEILKKFDLSTVKKIITGAAPMGEETAVDLAKMFPDWAVLQAYGMSELCGLITATAPDDIWFGSCGTLGAGFECRLLDEDGKEITEYDTPGEAWLKSPSSAIGYLNREEATRETFVNGYVRSGDQAMFKKHPKTGSDHLFITDRIKELIKTKGNQVAPAELEAHLLTHPAVQDCVVLGVPHEIDGEVPLAVVVKKDRLGMTDDALRRDIAQHVEQHKARYKWLKGGVEFIDVVPKTPSGKILRRLVRDKIVKDQKRGLAKL